MKTFLLISCVVLFLLFPLNATMASDCYASTKCAKTPGGDFGHIPEISISIQGADYCHCNSVSGWYVSCVARYDDWGGYGTMWFYNEQTCPDVIAIM